jgi:isopentenyl-diphosphate delta-isomerase
VELWDLTDEQGDVTGEVIRRGAVEWPEGSFHVVAATCAVRADGLLLMTRRSATKDFPLAWEFPGGSALAGESSRQAAVRELREETGILTAEVALEFVGRFVESSALVDLYVTIVPGEPELLLDPIEVHEADWVTVAEAERRHTTGQMSDPWAERLNALWPDLRTVALSAVKGQPA